MQTINNITFHNDRKLADAQRAGGDDFDAVVAHYEANAGKYDVVEATPVKEVKVTKKARAKKTTK